MKFETKDASEIPQLGVRQMAYYAKTLGASQVIVVNERDLPYSDQRVLKELSEWTGQKWEMHSLNGEVIFQRAEKSDKPDTKLTFLNENGKFPAVKTLRCYGKHYYKDLVSLGDEFGGFVLYKTAFSTRPAWNTVVSRLRVDGYQVEKNKHRATKVTVIKTVPKSAKKQFRQKSRQVSKRSFAWAAKYIAGREQAFTDMWNDRTKSQLDICKVFGIDSVWRVSAAGKYLGFPKRLPVYKTAQPEAPVVAAPEVLPAGVA